MEYYRNLLTFVVVSGIAALVLGVALLLQGDMAYMPFVVTFDVGLLLMIVVSVSEIIALERAKERGRDDLAKQPVQFDRCPDNFVKRTLGDKEICSNELIVRDPSGAPGKTVILKTYPADDPSLPLGAGQRPFPSRHALDYTGNEPKHEKFPLNEIAQSELLPDNAAKCALLYGAPTDPKLSKLVGYDLLPWTTMRARCAPHVSIGASA